MIFSKSTKRIINYIFTGICIGITPFAFQLADAGRGYSATGGEIFIPMIPLFVYMFKRGFIND